MYALSCFIGISKWIIPPVTHLKDDLLISSSAVYFSNFMEKID